MTDNEGYYQLTISNRDPNNQYIVRPDTMNYQFTPPQTPILTILQDTSGVDFVNTRMDTISGSVQACGNFCFGAVDVRIIDMQGCFEYIVRTTECGVFKVAVPARTPSNPLLNDQQVIKRQALFHADYVEPKKWDLPSKSSQRQQEGPLAHVELQVGRVAICLAVILLATELSSALTAM